MITPSALVLALWITSSPNDPSPSGTGCSATVESVIGNNRPEILLSVQGIAPLGDGRLAIADRLDYRLKVFGPAGNLVATVGGRGKKDGQFRGPGPIDCSSRVVAVADFASGRIQIFSRSFHHLRTLDVPGSVSDLCFDARGSLWVSIIRPDNRGELLQYSSDGGDRKSVPLKNASGNPFHDVCALAATPRGEILVAYLTRNIVEVRNSSGTYLGQFAVPGLSAASPVELLNSESGLRGLEVPLGVLIWNITVDGKGRIYVLGGEYARNPGREVFVLDTGGKIHCSLWIPEPAVRIRADREWNLWAVSASRGSVVQYRLSRRGVHEH